LTTGDPRVTALEEAIDIAVRGLGQLHQLFVELQLVRWRLQTHRDELRPTKLPQKERKGRRR